MLISASVMRSVLIVDANRHVSLTPRLHLLHQIGVDLSWLAAISATDTYVETTIHASSRSPWYHFLLRSATTIAFREAIGAELDT